MRDRNLALVLAEARRLSSDPKVIFRTVLTAFAESDLRVLANKAMPESYDHPHDGEGASGKSCGLFQQQVPWWGTVAEQMDPAASTRMFVEAFLRNKRLTDDVVADCWYTQRWSAPEPAKDPDGFRSSPQTVNYTRRLPQVQPMIDDPRYFTKRRGT